MPPPPVINLEKKSDPLRAEDSKRSYGLFSCKSSLMTSVQDFFQILSDQNKEYKRPDQNRVKRKETRVVLT